MTSTIASEAPPELGLSLAEQLVAVRRDLHKNAEPGWCEFRTGAKIVAMLRSLGWEVRYGRDVVCAASRRGLPDAAVMDEYWNKAASGGADREVLNAMKGGFTGVVGTFKSSVPGPIVALRFDIDANWGNESDAADHAPLRRGFASINRGVHHNCGHDGHTAIGLAVARAISESGGPDCGEIRLIFQPAEEGLRGANAMVPTGILSGVDCFFGLHVGVQALTLGEVICGYRNILASTKLDVDFHGQNAHAGISPHMGNNAVLAACVATQNLLAIPRHGDGETRVNVGLIAGGESRNAIPAKAMLAAELRADTTAILDHLFERADAVLRGSAQMNNVRVEVTQVGGSCGASSDPELADVVRKACRSLPRISSVRGVSDFKGSDDAATMMDAVQRGGGKAVYFGLGTRLPAVHHNPLFDFDEEVLGIGTSVLMEAVKLCQATFQKAGSASAAH